MFDVAWVVLSVHVIRYKAKEACVMSDDRPNPLGKIASTVGVAWAGAASIVTALVTFGVLSTAQAGAIQAAGTAAPDTITALGTVIAGVTALVGAIVAAFRTAAHGKDEVTPISDPRGVDPVSGSLVPLVPAPGPSGT